MKDRKLRKALDEAGIIYDSKHMNSVSKRFTQRDYWESLNLIHNRIEALLRYLNLDIVAGPNLVVRKKNTKSE